MRWLRVWWRSLRRRYPGKPNGRALDPAFQRAARIPPAKATPCRRDKAGGTCEGISSRGYGLCHDCPWDHTPNAVTVAAMREAERRT
jgi:hypothetical protein